MPMMFLLEEQWIVIGVADCLGMLQLTWNNQVLRFMVSGELW
jgi:hypothetical protein